MKSKFLYQGVDVVSFADKGIVKRSRFGIKSDR